MDVARSNVLLTIMRLMMRLSVDSWEGTWLDGRKVSLGSEAGHCFESRPGSYRYTLTWIVCRRTVIDWVYFPNGCVLLSLGIFNVQDT